MRWPDDVQERAACRCGARAQGTWSELQAALVLAGGSVGVSHLQAATTTPTSGVELMAEAIVSQGEPDLTAAFQGDGTDVGDAEKDEYIRELELKCLIYERAWDKQAELLAKREGQLAAADLAMQQIQAILRIRL